ncbi:MAG: SdrD B-like domain-containing protein [Thiolinea sp.]
MNFSRALPNSVLVRFLCSLILWFASEQVLALGCTAAITYINDAGTNTSRSLSAGQALKISRGTYTGSINSFPVGATICVESGATFRPSNLNNPAGNLINYGTANLANFSYNTGAVIDNYGLLNFTGGLNFNGTATIRNRSSATMVMENGFTLANASLLENDGLLIAKQDFNTNSGTTINNNYRLEIEGNFNPSGVLTNYGRIYAKKFINANSDFSFNNYCTLVSYGGFNNNSLFFSNWGTILITSANGVPGGLWQNNQSFYNGDGAKVAGGGFTNNGSMSGYGAFIFSGETRNQGTFSGASAANPINFYDETQTGSFLFDYYNLSATDTIRSPFARPTELDAATTCNNTYKSFAALNACPVGGVVQNQTGTVAQASGNGAAVENVSQAIGVLQALNTTATASNSAKIIAGGVLTLDLGQVVPADAPISISLARVDTARVRIEVSLDGVVFSNKGTFGSSGSLGTSSANVLARLVINANPGGTQYIRLTREAGSMWVDGAEYVQACVESRDYGDAPASYGVAAHKMGATNLYLGSNPDAEGSSAHSIRANGDGNEDDGPPPQAVGAAIPSFAVLQMTDMSYSTTIRTTNQAGTVAKLTGWIDFDKNGSFDADERASVDVPTGSNNINTTLTWPSIPADITLGTTYVRLRFTTDATAALQATGIAPNGEVEDFILPIHMDIPPNSPSISIASAATSLACQSVVFQDDFNDLPPAETNYWGVNRAGALPVRSWTASGGGADTYARFTDWGLGYGTSIYFGDGDVRNISPSLGSGFSFDAQGKLLTTIDAIALRDSIDDLDASGTIRESHWGVLPVTLSRSFATTVGKTYRLYFSALRETGDFLPGIMRVDAPGGAIHFKAPGGTEGILDYAIDFTATGSSSSISFVNYGHFGPNSSGYCNVVNNAWCTVGGLDNDGKSANELSIDNVKLVEAACATGGIGGYVYQDANLNNTYDMGTETTIPAITVKIYDEKGSPTDFTDDRLVATQTSFADGHYLFEQLDANASYRVEVDMTDPDLPSGLSMGTPNPFSGLVPLVNNVKTANFGLDPAGSSGTEDYGDAPASYGDASHSLVSGLQLGANAPDAELTSQPSFNALGDGYDEDGPPHVVAPSGPAEAARFPVLKLTDTSYTLPYTVTNSTGTLAQLYAWIDFDKSGSFEADEGTSVVVPSGLVNSTLNLTWSSIPSDIKLGTSFIRARLTTDAAVSLNTPTGSANSGEVEDYPIAIYQPIAADSQSINIVNNASPLACQQTIFQDNFNDISGSFSWGFYVPGSQDIRNWVRSGGGPDTYADVNTVIPAQQTSVYFGNGAVRGIAPDFFNGFSFDSNGHLVSPIEAVALRDVADDFNLGVGMSQWGPEPMRLTRSFNTQAGKTYRLYFKAIPEQGNFAPGVMRVDAPGGSLHFKAPGGAEAIQSYAIEFTATANTSTIAFVNYGHVSSDWCDPQASDWCTTGGVQNGTAPNELMIDDVVLAESACNTGTISGRVYLDANKNDSYDPAETGINAIKVSLYDQNGTVNDPNDDRLVYTTNSDSSGVYAFSTVDTARTYRIEVDSADTDLPSGAALGTINPLLAVAVAANATTANQNFGFDTNTTTPNLAVVGEYRFDDCGSGGWQLDSSGNNNSALGTAQLHTENYKTYACTAASNPNWNIEVPHQANYALTSGAVSILFYDHKGIWASARLLDKGWTADQKLTLEMKPSTDWQHGTVSVNLKGNIIDTGETYYTSLGNGSLNDTQWVHAVVSFGPAGMKLYINGVLKGSHAYTGGIEGVLGNFRLPGVEGYFDEFYIFDQQPTDAQVSTLYNHLITNKTWEGAARSCNCGGGVSADYGDAPATYGEVSHQIVNSVYLGDNPPDAEIASKYSFNARADNFDDGAPRQDAPGVYIPSFPVLQLTDTSYSADFKVTNLTGTAGKLHGWIDFDKSGSFEADEAAVVDVPSGSNNATATLNWAIIPSDIQLGTVALRVRLSTDTSVEVNTPTGSANDGEVEDHPIAIAMDIPPNSTSLAIVNGATPAACESVVFQDDFNDLTPGIFWGFNRAGSQAIRNWDRFGGGNDTYAHISASSATDRSIYFGNGGVREISPAIDGGFSFDANGKLLTLIDAIALRDDMDDIITPGTTVNEYGSKADWGPEPVKFSRAFSTVAGRSYRLYFKATPEDPAGNYESGIMRLDMPGGAIHFKAPGSAEGVQTYAVEFTATSDSSIISFVNYGHIENDANKFCDPNGVFNNNVWCTVGGRTDSKNTNELIIDDVVLTEAACATGSIRGRVYIDADQDDTHDAGIEAGIGSIAVRLYDENGTPGNYSDDRLVNTKSTYVNGEYYFTEVNTNRSYRLEVDTTDSELPAHAVIGTANPLTSLTVAANALLDNQNFGFDVPTPSNIVGTVYLDNNTNDSFDPGADYGIGNITVSLHTMAGSLVATTQTAINGKYQFANLDHTLSYRLTVDDTDTELPPGATLGTVNPIANISVPQNGSVTKDVGFDQAANGITGKVFLDYNLNGQLDSQSAMSNFANNMNIGLAFDKGIANAQIKAECVGAAGTLSFGPVTSDVNGQYYLATPGAVAGNYNCILQLTTLPNGYTVATQAGSGHQVLTQVVSPNAVNTYFALQQEASYCQNNPELAVNRFAYGQQTVNSPFAGNNDVANIFAFPYNSGTAGAPNTLPSGYNHPLETDAAFKDLALANQVGSVFGLGWHPNSHSLFASAYMKAWTGFGSAGTGGIYRVDLSNPSSPASSLYADLNQIFPATPPTAGNDPYLTGIFSSADPGYVQIADGSSAQDGSYVASGNATRDNQDGQIAGAVGKTAFGDLDVSADGKSLFVVNMANNKLYILPLRSSPLTAADAGLITSYSIPFAANCRVNGTKRAFGLGEYEGGLYVATECGAEYGHPWEVPEHAVFRFDLQSKTFSTTPSLVYARSSEDTYGIGFSLITDLVFDPAGQMILTFRNNLSSSSNTTADDGKGSAYSVIRRACIQDKAAYLWEKENNATCGGVTTPGKDAGYGTGPNSGTFFYQEYPADNGPALRSASYGGAAQIPGFMEMAYTIAEPFEFYSVGISWVDTGLGNPATAGQRNRAYSFYKGTGAFEYPDNRPVNGKNAAIGDLEILCDTPSLEIGNRVWQDSDSDGVQDAGEPPMAGVKVELFANGANLATATPLATVLTDTNGYYAFSSDLRGYPASGNNAPNDTAGANGGFNPADIQGGRASMASHKYGLTSLVANTQYQVVIRDVAGASKQLALTTATLTSPAQGADAERDSDGALVGNHAVATVNLLAEGHHSHAVDFGFISGGSSTGSISGKVFEDVNYGGGAGRNASAAGTAGISGTQLELYNSTGGFVSSTTTAADGAYSFSNVAAGNYFVRVVNASVNSTRPGSDGNELGVQTFRSDGTSAVTNEVGGRKPALVDATANMTNQSINTSTFVLSGGGQAQSVQPVTIAAATISGADFGFNFSTVINTNDSGQGSLRQFITNANLLGGDSTLAQNGRTAGKENAILELVTSDPNYNATQQYWSIAVQSELPLIGDNIVIDGSTQPARANFTFANRPTLELNGSNIPANTWAHGLRIDGATAGSTIRYLAINRFENSGIKVNQSTNSLIEANYIGTDPTATAKNLGNIGHGINVISPSGLNVIQNNVIAYNLGHGITAWNFNGVGTATAATISNNNIYANGGLGIDLGINDSNSNVTLNDANDADTGANSLLNFPILSSISLSGVNLIMQGCAPAGATVELFEADVSSGGAATLGANKFSLSKDYGEGQTYLTSFVEGSALDTDSANCALATDADGNNQTGLKAFSVTIPAPAAFVAGDTMTATATVAGTGTSEFSPIVTYNASCSLVVTTTADTDNTANNSGSLRDAIECANSTPGVDSITFNMPNTETGFINPDGVTNNGNEYWRISLNSQLPSITEGVSIDGRTQTSNKGNTNSGNAAAAATVGADNIALAAVAAPEVEIVGQWFGAGFDIKASHVNIYGLGMRLFDTNIRMDQANTTHILLNGLALGVNLVNGSDPGAGQRSNQHIAVNASEVSFVLTNSLLGFNDNKRGIVTGQYNNVSGVSATISGNHFIGVGMIGNTENAAIEILRTQNPNVTISGNRFVGRGTTVATDLAVEFNDYGGGNSTCVTCLVENNSISGFHDGVGYFTDASLTGLVINKNRIYSNTEFAVFLSNVQNASVAQNYLYDNGKSGVLINKNAATGNIITQNHTYNNGEVGINLAGGNQVDPGGITLNDANDMDSGPNSLLNFPILQQLVISNGNITARGCAPAGSVIEFFEADVSQGGAAVTGANRFGLSFDYGEGQFYLGSMVEGSVADVDTGDCAMPAFDGHNNTGMKAFQFSVPTPASVVEGDYLTASATLANIGTSEFGPSTKIISGPPPIGAGSCAATGGSDILFIVDNSGSITELEYADFAQTIQTVGSQLLLNNPKNRIAVAHFGGPSDSLVGGGQYVYIERDFSSAPMLAPVRQFAWGGAYNSTWIADHLAGALQQMRYALDGQAATTSSYILSPLMETSRNTSSPLQIVLMTDAARYSDAVPSDISMLIDPPGSGAEPDDGSVFTVYNQMKAEGVSFSVASFNADPTDIAASAAIASVGGGYVGPIEPNTQDPQGSQTTPRRYISVTSGFQLTNTQLDELVEGTSICGSSIQGLVFEDPNYGGGAGRPFGTLGTVGIAGATIEVYDQTGNYLASVVSTTDGKYSLPNLPDAPYYVRVVDATVNSSRLGSNGSEIPVLTYHSDGLVATTTQIGGNQPILADAGVNTGIATLNTTTFLFNGGGLTGKPAQSIQLVTLSGSNMKEVDFGFNFSTVVNTNDSGQGSLRQFLLNNKQLATDSLAQVLPAALAAEYPAGTETSIFMIPATQLTAGQAMITLTSGALSLERMNTAIDGRTQIANIGSGTIVLDSSISNALNLLATATGSAVRDITVSQAAGSGVLLDDTDNAVIERVAMLNNSQYGISLTNDALNNRVVANTIAHNTWAGIAHLGSGLGNTYSQNSIHDNGGLGIDLGVDGVTANDDLDVDTGPNKLLNYPVVEAGSSISSNGTKVVAYDFDLDVPSNTHGYRLEFFRNTAVDSSTHGEGEIYLGYVDINHAGGALLNFKGSLNANQTVPANANIAVTLTEKTSPTTLGSTSEFSGVKNGSVSVCTDLINGTGAEMTVNENAPVITYLEATDDSGNPITYVISGGADGNQFIVQDPAAGATLDCTLLTFRKPSVVGARSSSLTKALPLIRPGDYEAPVDSGGDNTYDLMITATVNGQTYERPVTVGVQDINEPPSIINNDLNEVLEGKTGTALNVDAFDPDAGDEEGKGLSYALSGGADRARFKLNAQTGELSFVKEPDFEAPLDAGNDNVYDIDVRVMDDQGLSSVSSLKIAVTDDKLNDGISLQTKVLLQGPYAGSTGLMQDSLRSLGLLPITQPYTANPFNYQGTEQLNLDLATVTGKDAIVDWVLVELRDAVQPNTVVAGKAALVQRDGDVIDATTGSTVLNFKGLAAGNYVVSLRHRNHLGVKTAAAVAFNTTPVVIDFSQTATLVAGAHARLESSSLALLWAGDVTHDARLILIGVGSDTNAILTTVLKAPTNLGLNSSYRLLGYLDTDLNMDGNTLFIGPSNDNNVLLGNVFLFPSNTNKNSNYIVVGGLAN